MRAPDAMLPAASMMAELTDSGRRLICARPKTYAQACITRLRLFCADERYALPLSCQLLFRDERCCEAFAAPPPLPDMREPCC